MTARPGALALAYRIGTHAHGQLALFGRRGLVATFEAGSESARREDADAIMALIARCEAAEARLAACADVEAVVVRMCQQADAALARADYWQAQADALADLLADAADLAWDHAPSELCGPLAGVNAALAAHRGTK